MHHVSENADPRALANAACSKSLRSLRSNTYGKEGTRSTRSTRASNASSVCWLTPHVHTTHSTTHWHTPKEHKQQARRTLGRSTELDAAILLSRTFRDGLRFVGEVVGSRWSPMSTDSMLSNIPILMVIIRKLAMILFIMIIYIDTFIYIYMYIFLIIW